jgi:hypothetical protein
MNVGNDRKVKKELWDMGADSEHQFKAASDKVRKETLPTLGKAYDETGPAAVLALTLMLADIWLESGFTVGEWREIIDVYDLRTEVGALRRR